MPAIVTLYSCGFFFQAEDGIRDVAVTGVQTCALPILADQIRGEYFTTITGKPTTHTRTVIVISTAICFPVKLSALEEPLTSRPFGRGRSEEHTSELQSRLHLVCRLLLEKKNNTCSSSIALTTASLPPNFTFLSLSASRVPASPSTATPSRAPCTVSTSAPASIISRTAYS